MFLYFYTPVVFFLFLFKLRKQVHTRKLPDKFTLSHFKDTHLLVLHDPKNQCCDDERNRRGKAAVARRQRWVSRLLDWCGARGC